MASNIQNMIFHCEIYVVHTNYIRPTKLNCFMNKASKQYKHNVWERQFLIVVTNGLLLFSPDKLTQVTN